MVFVDDHLGSNPHTREPLCLPGAGCQVVDSVAVRLRGRRRPLERGPRGDGRAARLCPLARGARLDPLHRFAVTSIGTAGTRAGVVGVDGVGWRELEPLELIDRVRALGSFAPTAGVRPMTFLHAGLAGWCSSISGGIGGGLANSGASLTDLAFRVMPHPRFVGEGLAAKLAGQWTCLCLVPIGRGAKDQDVGELTAYFRGDSASN